jgi:hypothetical protein
MREQGFVVVRQLLPKEEVDRLLAMVESDYRVGGVEFGVSETWTALEDPKLHAVWQGAGFPADRFPSAEARLVQNPKFLHAHAYFLTALYDQPAPSVVGAVQPPTGTPSPLSCLDASSFTDKRWEPTPPTVTFPHQPATRVGPDLSMCRSIGCNDLPAAFDAIRDDEKTMRTRQPWEPHAVHLQVRALQRAFSVPVPMMAC